jgi:hypothetical protein
VASDIYSLGATLYALLVGATVSGRLAGRDLAAGGAGRAGAAAEDQRGGPTRSRDNLPEMPRKGTDKLCHGAGPRRRSAALFGWGNQSRPGRWGRRNESLNGRNVGRPGRLYCWSAVRPCLVILGTLYHNARLNNALEKGKESQTRAEANFQKAMAAVDRMLTRVGENKDLRGFPNGRNTGKSS